MRYVMDNLDIDHELFSIIKEDGQKNETVKPVGADIDYDDPEQLKKLVAKHLAKIWMATYKEKFIKEVDKLRPKRT